MRRKIWTVAFIAVIAVVQFSFASGKTEEGAAGNSGPVKLTQWAWIDIAPEISAYEAEHPNVQIELVRLGPWDLHDKLLVALSSGAGAPDVVNLVQRRFPQYSATGKLVDLTPYVKDKIKDFDPGLISIGTYQGKIYGLPNDVSPGVMYYRKDILAKVGIDKIDTFDQLRAAGKKIKEAGYWLMPIFYPSGSWGADAMNLYLHSMGGNLYTSDGKVKTDNPELLATLKYLYDLYYVDETVNGIKWFNTEFYAALKDGKYAVWPMNMAEGGNIKKYMPEESGMWGVMGFPQWKSSGEKMTGVWGGTMSAVPTQSKNQKAAIDWILYLTTTVDGQVLQSKTWNAVPSYKPALKADYYSKPDPFFGTNLYEKIYSLTPYYYFDWAQTEQIVGNQLDKMFGGQHQGYQETYNGIIHDLQSQLNR